VALLELLATSAWAQIVATDLGRVPAHGLRNQTRPLRGGRATTGARTSCGGLLPSVDLRAVAHLHRLLLTRVFLEVLALHALDLVLLLHLNAEELGADVGAGRRHHVDEDVVALLLVLLLRITLAIAAQPDSVPEVLHVGEVLDPRVVDLFQVVVAEDAEEQLGAHVLLASLE